MRYSWRLEVAGVGVAGIAFSALGPAAQAGTNGRYSVPELRLPFMAAPPINGVVRPSQWAGADRMVGFARNGPALAPLPAHFWVGGNARDLFIAVVSATPPGGRLLARGNPMPPGVNAMVGLDDDVEVWVDSSPGAKQGTVYAAIVNARGAIWQEAFKTNGGGAPAWQGHWRIGSKVIGNRWNLELAIPWRDLGITRIAGRTVGLRICRDWKQVPGGGEYGWQTEWSPLGGPFSNPASMARIGFTPTAPVVQVLQLQDKPNDPANIRVSIRNPSAAPLTVGSSILIAPRAGRRLIQRMAILHPGASAFRKMTTQRQTLTLAGHQMRIVQAGSLAVAGEPLYTQIQVRSAQGPTVFYRRNFQWNIHRPRRLWAVNQGASRRIDTAFGYYPSYNVMQVRVNLKGLPNRAKVRAVRLQVVDQRTHRIIAATTLTPRHGVARLHAWKLPPLRGALIRATGNRGGFLHEWRKLPRDGRYHLVVRLVGIPAKPRAYSFVRYYFPWEHNKLGEANVVIPPFTPIQVHGKTVDVILRQYTMNGLGLWRQVQALGRNLLTGPMRLVVRADGKRFVGRGRLEFTRITPTRVVAVAQWSAGPLSGASRSVWDYDGMMKTFLTLEPTREKLDSVALVIPLVNKRMPLMTACTDGLRFNYAGKIPAGWGMVWNGRQAPHNYIIGSYVPYIWTGGPERGVAVFGDNDRGWVDYQAKTPCQELVRKGDGTLELRLNLVAKPARLTTAHRIVLGFQATPIKPMPRNWRLWTLDNTVPGCYNLVFAGASYYWGSLGGDTGDLYPRGGDFSIYRQFARTRRTGKIPWGFVKHWLAGYRAPSPADAANYGPSVKWLFQGLAGKPQGVIVYTSQGGVRPDRPSGQTYLNQWDGHRFPTRHWAYGSCLNFSVNSDKSFRDYSMWYYRKMLTTFDDGIYWDNSNIFMKDDFNTISGTDAYRLPDGYIQPGGSLWASRALVRRTAILDYQLAKPDLNMMHMTNTAIAPILAFARIDLDWEMNLGENAFQDRFRRSFILTETIGRQFGNVPRVLEDMSGHNPKKLAWADRTFAGVTMTYELAGYGGGPVITRDYRRLVKFGYGTPRVKVWNYWRRGYPMKVAGDKTSSIILGKPGRALIVVCDWGHGGVIRLKLKRRVLRLPGRLAAMDMGTKQPLEVSPDGSVIVFPLKKHDFKMLLVK